MCEYMYLKKKLFPSYRISLSLSGVSGKREREREDSLSFSLSPHAAYAASLPPPLPHRGFSRIEINTRCTKYITVTMVFECFHIFDNYSHFLKIIFFSFLFVKNFYWIKKFFFWRLNEANPSLKRSRLAEVDVLECGWSLNIFTFIEKYLHFL